VTLEEFTQITLQVLEEQSLATYAPTLVVEGMIQVVEGIPEGMDHREAIQDLVRRAGLVGRDFLFGLRTGKGEITTGHHGPEGTRFQRILALQHGFMIVEPGDCAWWRLDAPEGPGA
jgi:hypothetical protein